MTHLKKNQLFLDEYTNCFTDSILGKLPPSRGEDDHKIEIIPVSLAQQEDIMAQVNELVEKGMVRPSSSPFCSPMLLVQKKDGSYRMCVDYCALKKNTIKNYPRETSSFKGGR